MASDSAGGARVLDWHQAVAAPFEPAWRAILLERVPFYRILTDEERDRFEAKVKVFVLTKSFGSLDDLVVTEEMKVVVAATACRLTMNMPWEDYRQMGHVVLRAGSFTSDGERVAGCAGRQNVTVSWPALVHGLAHPDDGSNIGYHEFAHALDAADGSSDGEAPGPVSDLYDTWGETMSAGRAEVQRALDANVKAPIDAYAAKNDAEFFAVATVWFFERPCSLRENMPAVYDHLSRFYRQDPAAEARFHEACPDVDEWRLRREEEPTPEPALPTGSTPRPERVAGLREEQMAAHIGRVDAPGRERARRPVHIPDPPEWHFRELLRVVAWSCIFVAMFLLLPCTGSEGGQSHEPGADTVAALSFTHGAGLAALILAGSGLVVLAGSYIPDLRAGSRDGHGEPLGADDRRRSGDDELPR
jgi:MtfA peptidase